MSDKSFDFFNRGMRASALAFAAVVVPAVFGAFARLTFPVLAGATQAGSYFFAPVASAILATFTFCKVARHRTLGFRKDMRDQIWKKFNECAGFVCDERAEIMTLHLDQNRYKRFVFEKEPESTLGKKPVHLSAVEEFELQVHCHGRIFVTTEENMQTRLQPNFHIADMYVERKYTAIRNEVVNARNKATATTSPTAG